MFWIGFIVGMVVLALIVFGIFVLSMKLADSSWDEFNRLVELNGAALLNRDCRVEVISEDDDEKVFEARFAYPWSDDVND